MFTHLEQASSSALSSSERDAKDKEKILVAVLTRLETIADLASGGSLQKHRGRGFSRGFKSSKSLSIYRSSRCLNSFFTSNIRAFVLYTEVSLRSMDINVRVFPLPVGPKTSTCGEGDNETSQKILSPEIRSIPMYTPFRSALLIEGVSSKGKAESSRFDFLRILLITKIGDSLCKT